LIEFVIVLAIRARVGYQELYDMLSIKNVEVFKNHFETLYNMDCTYDPTVVDEIPINLIKESLAETITQQEIQKALSKMKYEKHPDPNGIPTEGFKNLQGKALHEFTEIIQEFWNNDEFEMEEWHISRNLAFPYYQKQEIYPTPTNGVE
jgi:hypothetical protein